MTMTNVLAEAWMGCVSSADVIGLMVTDYVQVSD